MTTKWAGTGLKETSFGCLFVLLLKSWDWYNTEERIDDPEGRAWIEDQSPPKEEIGTRG